MNLSDYQKDIVDQIYTVLTNEDENCGITLYGGTGSGKSTIAQGVINQLLEGWTIFYIEGIDPELSPYLTWHIGTKLHSKHKLTFGGEISFGVSFLPIPLSLEFIPVLQRQDQHYILTSSEEALISAIEKQAGENHNILFVVDNYELWDTPSKQLLQKIMTYRLKLLSNFHLTILLLSHEEKSIGEGLRWHSIPIPEISDDNILFILRQQGHSGQININDIRLCAGNDLSLALMAAAYYDGSDISSFSFSQLLEKKYQNLSLETRKACKVLEPLSIIDSCFTKNETAYFIDPAPLDATAIEYQAEECLMLAKEQMFISGAENYHFSNDKVKLYFKQRLSRKALLYHRKFANYLQKRHPEDYFSRGKHLELSLQTNDPKIILDAWQLLFLSYIRRSLEIENLLDIYNIQDHIELLLDRLDPDISEPQHHVWDELCASFEAFSKFQYRQVIYHLQAINESQLVLACRTEVQRLILLCHVQIAENIYVIQQQAANLYDTINDYQFCEDEQYCRAALLLLDIYIDRFNEPKKVRVLQKNLIQIIQQHLDRQVFQEFEACYNRKASLYFTAVIASRQTTQSIRFYRKHHNRYGLFMALCNHLGNTIVSGDYDAAEQTLTECMDLLRRDNEIYYPSLYKIENNKILLTYLQDEKRAGSNRLELLKAAEKAALALSYIIDHQENETSYVILFNYLGLSILCDANDWQSRLERVQQLVEADEYYQFFLHDLIFSAALLQGDIAIAQNELTLLKKLNVPLLLPYRQIFFKRLCEQEELLKNPERLNGDPIIYHEAIKAVCSHVQDPSCQFYGRGFLLSDLQFLSL